MKYTRKIKRSKHFTGLIQLLQLWILKMNEEKLGFCHFYFVFTFFNLQERLLKIEKIQHICQRRILLTLSRIAPSAWSFMPTTVSVNKYYASHFFRRNLLILFHMCTQEAVSKKPLTTNFQMCVCKLTEKNYSHCALNPYPKRLLPSAKTHMSAI